MTTGPSADRLRAAGIAVAVGSGLAYAATTVAQRDLADAGLPPSTVLAVRFGLGGLLLFGLQAGRRASLRPAPGEGVHLAVLGGVLYATEATVFFVALRHGTAGAVTLLFYAWPALVTLTELVRGRVRPSARLGLAFGLSAAGTVVVVGTAGEVAITGFGVVLALAAAGLFATYVVLSDRWLHHTPPRTRAAWIGVTLAAGVLVGGTVTGDLERPSGGIALLVVGLCGAAAIGLFFEALPRIGATATSVALTSEPVGAVALGAVFLAEPVGAGQAVGGAAVLAAAVILALPVREELETAAGT